MALKIYIASLSAGAMVAAAPALAQSEQPVEDIIVVGSQIKGAKTTDAIPVSVVGTEEIAATASVSANELFRSIPQAGDVSFSEANSSNANYAKGDISTVSLRNLGPGNTLVLLNGRRILLHPESQLENQVPVFAYNVNAIPVAGLERLEVLRDGAAALYGADAVAGVVNNVLKTDFKGLELSSQYGGAEGTGLREFSLNGQFGTDFSNGRGSVSLFASYLNRTALDGGEQDFTATSNRLALVAGTPFEGVLAFDTRSSNSAWGAFQSPTANGTVRSNGTVVTNASGFFHVQPTSSAGCQVAQPSSAGTCFDDGNVTGAADRNLRLDTAASFPTLSVTPSTKRINLFSSAHYDLTDDITVFGELGFYRASSTGYVAPNSLLGSSPITVAANAYWNPFGPVGSPNRLPGLNIPAAGLPVTIRSYNITDGGPRRYDVLNYQYRLLAGFRGEVAGWSWESAGLYTWATVRDTVDAFSSSGLQAAINRTTPDAYNPFSGGDPANPSVGDTTPSNAAAIDSFRIRATRNSRTSMALWDLKLSNADVFSLPAGDVGIAAGIELRRETFRDRRDPHQSGEIAYVDSITGINYGSDFLGQSTRKDVDGKRTIFSAYAEAAVPIISPDMDIPLIRQIDLQLAGRYERYSDVGSVAKPKIAGFWDVIDGVRLRASWSGGFRAPNLEVLNTPVSEGSTSGTDYVLCEADLRAGRITSFSACSRSQSIQRRIDGNQALKPETSTSFSYGLVLEPKFIPSRFGKLTLTLDRWRIQQKGVVGVVDFTNAVALDYLLRTQGGSNPAVVRRAPTVDDAALVAGTGLSPAGEILYVELQYQNLLPIDAEGLDIGLNYRLPDFGWGSLSINANAAHLIKFFQSPSDLQQQLLEGQAAGTINPAISIGNAGDQRAMSGKPKWKFSLSATYENGPVQIGLFTQYIDAVNEAGVFNANNEIWSIDSQLTANLYVQYKFKSSGLDGTTLQIGARNITNEKPPLSSAGYLAALYTPTARYWYASVKKAF